MLPPAAGLCPLTPARWEPRRGPSGLRPLQACGRGVDVETPDGAGAAGLGLAPEWAAPWGRALLSGPARGPSSAPRARAAAVSPSDLTAPQHILARHLEREPGMLGGGVHPSASLLQGDRKG